MSEHSTVGNDERRAVYLLAAINLVALGSLTAPLIAGIPLKIDAMFPEDQRAAALATVLALGGGAALIANPVFGLLSDRTRGRLGRRRPWMLGGALVGLVSIAALAMSDSFAAIIISWICGQVAFNATLAAAAALLAETVPESRRATASGVFTAAAFIGTIPPLLLTALLPNHVQLVSLVMPTVALVVVGMAMTITESPLRATPTPRAWARGRSLALPPAFLAVWLQRLAMQSAFSLAIAFTIYLVIDRMTADPVTATPIATTATLLGGAGIVIGASVGGAWASRRQRYLPFLAWAAIGLAAGASLRAFADVPLVLWMATTVGGLAVGVYLAVNLALAMRVIPDGHAGAYLGVLNVAETIPQVLGPLAAAGLLRIGHDPISGATDNYFVLYLSAAVLALVSLAALPALRRTARAAQNAETGATPSRM